MSKNFIFKSALAVVAIVGIIILAQFQIEKNNKFQAAKNLCKEKYSLPSAVQAESGGLKFQITNLNELKINQEVLWYQEKMSIGGPIYPYCRISIDQDINVQISREDKIISNNKYYFRLLFTPNHRNLTKCYKYLIIKAYV
jgi:hypothetical protein